MSYAGIPSVQDTDYYAAPRRDVKHGMLTGFGQVKRAVRLKSKCGTAGFGDDAPPVFHLTDDHIRAIKEAADEAGVDSPIEYDKADESRSASGPSSGGFILLLAGGLALAVYLSSSSGKGKSR